MRIFLMFVMKLLVIKARHGGFWTLLLYVRLTIVCGLREGGRCRSLLPLTQLHFMTKIGVRLEQKRI